MLKKTSGCLTWHKYKIVNQGFPNRWIRKSFTANNAGFCCVACNEVVYL